ncbi:MarR family winged helix-turn-helix transcriptional regulator [Roseibium sp.]|uniref:MarR family winged helix-turn-helix transcriptional regulator n=1 Tax=Roseibium sp. TaxID=1936156 RepID=UPI003BA86252
MNEKTDQMSLLDAIGMPASGETRTRKKDNQDSAKATGAGKTTKPAKRKKKPASSVNAGKAAAADDVSAMPGGTDSVDDTPATESKVHGSTLPEMSAPLPLDRFICFALYSANHAMHSVYKDLLKDVGLTYPQFLAMTVLWEKNNVPVGAITSKLQLDTNTLTPLLKRLETMGLITRTRNTKDERQVILKLTRKGRALQKKTEDFSTCILSSTGIGMEEVMDLQRRIMKLRDNLRTAGTT